MNKVLSKKTLVRLLEEANNYRPSEKRRIPTLTCSITRNLDIACYVYKTGKLKEYKKIWCDRPHSVLIKSTSVGAKVTKTDILKAYKRLLKKMKEE